MALLALQCPTHPVQSPCPLTCSSTLCCPCPFPCSALSPSVFSCLTIFSPYSSYPFPHPMHSPSSLSDFPNTTFPFTFAPHPSFVPHSHPDPNPAPHPISPTLPHHSSSTLCSSPFLSSLLISLSHISPLSTTTTVNSFLPERHHPYLLHSCAHVVLLP